MEGVTKKKKRGLPKEDDSYVPPEIEEEDDDLDEVLRNQKPLKKKKGSKGGKRGKKRKILDLFNLETFRGQLLYLLREEDTWLLESQIRKILLEYFKSGGMEDFGFSLQISTQMGSFWKERKVDRKGFPGNFKYKLVDDLRDAKLSKKKKRKIKGESEEREDRDSSPPTSKKKVSKKNVYTEENMLEILLYILRKGEFLTCEKIHTEFLRLSQRQDTPIRKLKELLKKEPSIEFKGKKKKIEFRYEEKELQPLPKDFQIVEKGSQSRDLSPPLPQSTPLPPPKPIPILLGFKCPFEDNILSVEMMTVEEYVRKLFLLNPCTKVDSSSVFSHCRYLRKNGQLTSKQSLRSEFKAILDILHLEEKKIEKQSSKKNDVYVYDPNKVNNSNVVVPLPPPPPPPRPRNVTATWVTTTNTNTSHSSVRERSEFRYPSFANNDYIDSLLGINLERKIGTNQNRGMKEVIFTSFLERKIVDEDLIDEEREIRSCFSLTSEKGILVVYSPHEPHNSSKLVLLEQCRGFPKFLRPRYYGSLNEKLRKDVSFGMAQQAMSIPSSSIIPPPNPFVITENSFFVIYETDSNSFSYHDLGEKFRRPVHMMEFIIKLLDLIFEFRKVGLLISPNLNHVFFDADESNSRSCSFHLRVINPLISKPSQFRFVDMILEQQQQQVLPFPVDFIEDVKKKLLTIGWKLRVRERGNQCFQEVLREMGEIGNSYDLQKFRQIMIEKKKKEEEE